MKIASYRTERGAERYAKELGAIFTKRQFKAVQHPSEFHYTVGVYDDGKFLAYAGRRKRQKGGQ